MAFTPSFNSSTSPDDVTLVMIGINASSENAHIVALRQPPLYELHHGTDWGTDLFASLRFYRFSESSIQIYPNPSTHPRSSILEPKQVHLKLVLAFHHFRWTGTNAYRVIRSGRLTLRMMMRPHWYSRIASSFLPFGLVQSIASSETIWSTVVITAPAFSIRRKAISLPYFDHEADASAETCTS